MEEKFSISISDPWFDLIKCGKKRFEGRRYHYDVPKYKVGDEITIYRSINRVRTIDNFTVKVLNIHRFRTFEEAMRDSRFSLEEILPGIKTIEEGIELYKKYVSIETQLKDGICMIEIANIKIIA